MIVYDIDRHEANDIQASSFLQINSCGFQPPYREDVTVSRPKGRSDYQLIYLLSGHLDVVYQGECHHLSQGFVLYPPDTPQQYTDFQDTKRIWVHFSGHSIPEVLQDAQLEGGVHPIAFSPIIQELLLQLLSEHNQTGHISGEKGLFLSIVYLLGKQCNHVSSIDDAIKDVITFITTHFYSKLHIDELASSCKLSSSHFMHLFKEQTGLSPLAYQQALRMEYAKSALTSTNLSVSEIADHAGYSDPLYFSRIFKKVTGLSPKSYRRNYAHND